MIQKIQKNLGQAATRNKQKIIILLQEQKTKQEDMTIQTLQHRHAVVEKVAQSLLVTQ